MSDTNGTNGNGNGNGISGNKPKSNPPPPPPEALRPKARHGTTLPPPKPQLAVVRGTSEEDPVAADDEREDPTNQNILYKIELIDDPLEKERARMRLAETYRKQNDEVFAALEDRKADLEFERAQLNNARTAPEKFRKEWARYEEDKKELDAAQKLLEMQKQQLKADEQGCADMRDVIKGRHRELEKLAQMAATSRAAIGHKMERVEIDMRLDDLRTGSSRAIRFVITADGKIMAEACNDQGEFVVMPDKIGDISFICSKDREISIEGPNGCLGRLTIDDIGSVRASSPERGQISIFDMTQKTGIVEKLFWITLGDKSEDKRTHRLVILDIARFRMPLPSKVEDPPKPEESRWTKMARWQRSLVMAAAGIIICGSLGYTVVSLFTTSGPTVATTVQQPIAQEVSSAPPPETPTYIELTEPTCEQATLESVKKYFGQNAREFAATGGDSGTDGRAASIRATGGKLTPYAKRTVPVYDLLAVGGVEVCHYTAKQKQEQP